MYCIAAVLTGSMIQVMVVSQGYACRQSIAKQQPGKKGQQLHRCHGPVTLNRQGCRVTLHHQSLLPHLCMSKGNHHLQAVSPLLLDIFPTVCQASADPTLCLCPPPTLESLLPSMTAKLHKHQTRTSICLSTFAFLDTSRTLPQIHSRF